eukprot:1198979-Pyramimonas_sp.AAC.1
MMYLLLGVRAPAENNISQFLRDLQTGVRPARSVARTGLAHAFAKYIAKCAGCRHSTQSFARVMFNKAMPLRPDVTSMIGGLMRLYKARCSLGLVVTFKQKVGRLQTRCQDGSVGQRNWVNTADLHL